MNQKWRRSWFKSINKQVFSIILYIKMFGANDGKKSFFTSVYGMRQTNCKLLLSPSLNMKHCGFLCQKFPSTIRTYRRQEWYLKVWALDPHALFIDKIMNFATIFDVQVQITNEKDWEGHLFLVCSGSFFYRGGPYQSSGGAFLVGFCFFCRHSIVVGAITFWWTTGSLVLKQER